MKKRILSVILALAMLLPVFAVGTFALTPEEEAKQYMTEVLEIFGGGSFTMKTRSTAPFVGNQVTPLTIAIDDSRMAFEMPMEWRQLFQTQGMSNFRSTIMGWMAQLFFGKRLRVITAPDQIVIVFPEKKMYMPLDGEPGEPLDFDLDGVLGEAFNGAKTPAEIEEKLDGITAEYAVGGQPYLRVTIDNSGSIMRYYFLDGELKRIEAETYGETVTWEIDLLTRTVDPAFFSTAGMRTMPLQPLSILGNLF